MANYRVIVSGNSGDGLFYRIEDVNLISDHRHGLFIKHNARTGSVEELRTRLKEMLVACDRPPLVEANDLQPAHIPCSR